MESTLQIEYWQISAVFHQTAISQWFWLLHNNSTATRANKKSKWWNVCFPISWARKKNSEDCWTLAELLVCVSLIKGSNPILVQNWINTPHLMKEDQKAQSFLVCLRGFYSYTTLMNIIDHVLYVQYKLTDYSALLWCAMPRCDEYIYNHTIQYKLKRFKSNRV